MFNVTEEEVLLKEIVPYWQNPRTSANVALVKQSIEKYGYNQYILIDKNYVIIAGHSRWKALQELDYEKIKVLVSDMPADKAKEARIIDNKVSELNTWDKDKLIKELRTVEGLEDLQPFFDVSLEKMLDIKFVPRADIKIEDTITRSKDEYTKQSIKRVEKLVCPHCGEEFEIIE